MSFQCFRHSGQIVEAICTQPSCPNYRFFCVSCFLQQSSHLIKHQHHIQQIHQVLENQSADVSQNSGLSEITSNLNSIRSLIKDYESVVKSKRQSFLNVIGQLQCQFYEIKEKTMNQIDTYLSVLVQKQQTHFAYLDQKVKSQIQQLSNNSWTQVRKGSEQEITNFFQNLIRLDLSNNDEMRTQVRHYVQSFQRNLQELDGLYNQKAVGTFSQQFANNIETQFVELRELLLLSNQEDGGFSDYYDSQKQGIQPRLSNGVFKLQNNKSPPSSTNIENSFQPNLSRKNSQHQLLFPNNNDDALDQMEAENYEEGEKINRRRKSLTQGQLLINSMFGQIDHPMPQVFTRQNQQQTSNLVQSQIFTSKSDLLQVNGFKNQNSKPTTRQSLLLQNINNHQQDDNHNHHGGDLDIQGINDKYFSDVIPFRRKSGMQVETEENESERYDYKQSKLMKNSTSLRNGNHYPKPIISDSFSKDDEALQFGAGGKNILGLNSENSSPQKGQRSSGSGVSLRNMANLHTQGIVALVTYEQIESSSTKILASASSDQTIQIWRIEPTDFVLIQTLEGHNYPISVLERFKKDDNAYLASGSIGKEINIWNPSLESGKQLIASIKSQQNIITGLKFFDESLLLSSSDDQTLKVWDLHSCKCSNVLEQNDVVTTICMHEQIDEKDSSQKLILLSGCSTGFRIWHYLGDGEFKLKSYNNQAHKTGVTSIISLGQNSNQNYEVATAGNDGVIKLWNLSIGQSVFSLKEHHDAIYQMVYDPKKDCLYSASIDGTLRIWNDDTCVASLETGHQFNNSNPFTGDFMLFDEFGFALSVSNNDQFIKIIPF